MRRKRKRSGLDGGCSLDWQETRESRDQVGTESRSGGCGQETGMVRLGR